MGKEEKVLIANDDFKVVVVDCGGLDAHVVESGFIFIIKQGKAEIAIEPNADRKKILCKIYEQNGSSKNFEFTATQFKQILSSNTTKRAIKSEEEEIHEKAAKGKTERESAEITDPSQPIKRRRSSIKTKKTRKSSKKGK